MQGMMWKEIFAELAEDFMAWGCPYSRRKLPEIAMGYDCTELDYWNWMDGQVRKTETGFLRVLGYVRRKMLREEAQADPADLIHAGMETGRRQAA